MARTALERVLLGGNVDALNEATRQRLALQGRQAAREVASVSARSATNPSAIARNVVEAGANERQRIGAEHAQQLIAARAADEAQTRQLIGSLIGAGTSLVGMAVPAAAPLTGAAGNLLGGAVSGGGAASTPALAPQAVVRAPPSTSAPAVQQLLQSQAPAPVAPPMAPPASAAPNTPAVGQLLRSSVGTPPPVPRPAGSAADPMDDLDALYPPTTRTDALSQVLRSTYGGRVR